MSAELLKARFAVLLDHFKQPLSVLENLTDWQIEELYFHARNDEGVTQAAPAQVLVSGYQQESKELWTLCARGLIAPEDYERARQALKEKYKEQDGDRAS